jgi:glycosyltransferase involved in cell wall biosynthesis
MARTPDPAAKIGDVADAAGVERVHILAWRDLDDLEAGGSEIHADEIARRWAAAGLAVLLRTSTAPGHLPEVRRHGYDIARHRGRRGVFLDAPARELLDRRRHRDALLEVWNGMPFFAPLWARGPRATFVHHVHADMWRQVLSPLQARVGEALEVRVAPRVYQRTRILTPSPSSRDAIVRRLRLPPANVTAIPNGIDARFRPGPAKADHPLVACVGRLVPHKRVDALIRTLAVVRADVPGLELVVAGDGFERPNLERLVAELGAEAWVRLEGRIRDDEVVDLYQRAWLVASASSDEGWGMTLTEAAACGTPAVASRIPGHVDSVRDGTSGLLATGDAELVGAFRRVLGDPAERQRLSEGALARAQELTWDHTALEVLRGVVGPRS